MKILFLSAEVAPFSKSGGLGDVASALPAALARLGHEVLVVTPLYSVVSKKGLERLDQEVKLPTALGSERAGLQMAKLSGHLRVLFLDHPGFYGRPGLYGDAAGDYADNAQRFAFLCRGALAAAQVLGFIPNIVHLNDWQTGLTALSLRREFHRTELATARSLFTIHNLAYQGLFPRPTLEELRLPSELFTMDGLEFHGKLSFMKAGLVFADALSTVSPGYAREIQTAQYGSGLDGLLRARAAVLHGILNGIDETEWNPRADRFLTKPFSVEDLSGKMACKKEVLQKFGLAHSGEAQKRPLFVSIGRLVEQKGTDLLVAALERACENDLSFIALGSGETRFEEALRQLAQRHPSKVGVRIGFDAALSHLLEGAADFFVMPSRFEPCGLNQMYSLKYGAVPIVHATGGLDDTVKDISSPDGNGIKFQAFEVAELVRAIDRARTLYEQPEKLTDVRQRGMAEDHSWTASARAYEALYQSLTR